MLFRSKFGHISAVHIAALAREMKLAQTEVFEVASFYHHFDIVKEGDTPPPALTVRVCDSLSCEMGGANSLIAELKKALGDGVRVIPAPCVGRCEQAPVAVVGQNPVPQATVDKVAPLVAAKRTTCDEPKYLFLNDYLKSGGYALARSCVGVSAVSKMSSRSWKIPACAGWAARVFHRGASGASCARKKARA